MFGKKHLIWILLPLLGACGAQEYQDEVTERRLVGWIDDRQYGRVLGYLEMEATPEERVRLAPIEAQAHMGLGGYEILGVLESLKAPQNYVRPAFEAMSRGCPDGPLHAADLPRIEKRCLIVRFFNTLPDPNDPHLLQARDLWRAQLAQRGPLMDPTDRLLAATFEVSLIMSRAGKVFADYYDLSIDQVKTTDVIPLFKEIKSFAEDAKLALDSRIVTAQDLNRRFLGGSKNPLFETKLTTRIEFARKTALPRLIAISDLDKNGVEDRVVAASVVKELDNILVQFFKVKF